MKLSEPKSRALIHSSKINFGFGTRRPEHFFGERKKAKLVFQYFVSYLKLLLISEMYFFYLKAFVEVGRDISFHFFLMKHHSKVLVCIFGNK